MPYCVGEVDGTHVKWLTCPNEQFYEYRCYKGYPSIVIFAVVDAHVCFLYADTGRSGVLGDATIFERSTLKKNIDHGNWLGAGIPDLIISGVNVRPFLIGDFEYSLF